jgi:hypothetical protein
MWDEIWDMGRDLGYGTKFGIWDEFGVGDKTDRFGVYFEPHSSGPPK